MSLSSSNKNNHKNENKEQYNDEDSFLQFLV